MTLFSYNTHIFWNWYKNYNTIVAFAIAWTGSICTYCVILFATHCDPWHHNSRWV